MSRQFTAWLSIFMALTAGTIATEGLSMWQESVAGEATAPSFHAKAYELPETIALSEDHPDRPSPN